MQTEIGVIDQMIDKIFDLLPCTTYEEIANKLTKKTGKEINAAQVNSYLKQLRSHAEHYGWTVPHTKRGVNLDGDKRLFAMLLNRDGSYDLDVTPENKVLLEQGAMATLKHSAQMLANEAAAVIAAAQHVRSNNAKQLYKEVADDMSYTARKCLRVVAELEEEKNGTSR